MNSDNRFKPYWLPQISAPFTDVVDGLGNEGFTTKHVFANPNQLKPIQKVVDSDKIKYFNKLNQQRVSIDPIYISSDNEILDGHHRYYSAISAGSEFIHCIKIYGTFQDIARALNKIQDIYSYINDKKSFTKIDEKPKNQILKLYRSQDIKDNSKTGNFFFLENVDGKNPIQFDIEFDNLYTITDENVLNSKNPVIEFAKILIPSVDIVSNEHAANVINTILPKLGYDGVNYGKYVQSVKNENNVEKVETNVENGI